MQFIVNHTQDVRLDKKKLHLKYRPDIDGLRAIAVISVIFYHYFPARLPGGFIGVDIFFVISGYLISLILFNNFENSTFSYKEFYTRRVLRIFPALTLVLISTLITGWFYLTNNDYALLGKHDAAAAIFITNFTLAAESNYFDIAAISKPLLHLWSLGVEEQFYVIWPLIIGIFWKQRENFLFITVAVGIASFLFNIYNVELQPALAFYSPFSRFWELMVGAALAYLTLHKPRFIFEESPNIKSIFGLIMLFSGFIFLNYKDKFPGYWALLPCIGTFLIISSRDAWVNKNILGNKLFVFVGIISYPLYLWHWPLLSITSISIYGDTFLSRS